MDRIGNRESLVWERLDEFMNSKSSIGHNHRDTDFLWDSSLESIFESQTKAANDILVAISNIDQNFKPDKLNILDIGCSNGALLFGLKDSCSKAVGVEIEPEAIEAAKEYVKYKEYINMDFFVDDGIVLEKTIAKYPNFFDLIIVKEVIEHISNVQNFDRMVKNIKKILKPGGRIFFESPNYKFPFEPHLRLVIPPNPSRKSVEILANIFKRIRNEKERRFVSHLNFAGPRTIEKIIRNNGLDIINVYEEYKLPKILSGQIRFSQRYSFVGPIISLIRRVGLDKLILRIIKILDLYPTLWYLVKERNV